MLSTKAKIGIVVFTVVVALFIAKLASANTMISFDSLFITLTLLSLLVIFSLWL